ncbi:complement resistance protein TraT [Sulfurimonas sp.]|uniref:complement resistance protein TraT n=1 Tax=Sulfurimonas sp. TaxID=2022749 RepID=UPI00356736F4
MDKLLLTLFSLFILSGCGTMSLETSAKSTRTIILDHSQIKEKTIYIQVTNTANSGGELMDLSGSIKRGLTEKGYKIVDSSSDASYGLFVNVLFANNLKEANAVKAASGLGLSSGIIAMGSGSGTADSLLIGATAALAGAVGAKVLEDDTFKAVIDINLKGFIDNTDDKTRVFARAVKMNLDLKEAMPILEKESTRTIVNIF